MAVPRLRTLFIPADTSAFTALAIGGMCEVRLQNSGTKAVYIDTNKTGIDSASKRQDLYTLNGMSETSRPAELVLNAGGPNSYFNDGVVLYISNSSADTVAYVSVVMIDKRNPSPY